MGLITQLKYRFKTLTLVLAALLVALPAAQAAAQKPAEPRKAGPRIEKQKIKIELPKQDRQYRETTPPDKQEQARKIFHLANERFEQRRVDEALRLYQKAYALWPHPRILFNMAVSRGFLSQPLRSAQTFAKVLRYGPEPINPERYKQASDRYLELMGQLAVLQVKCGDVGANLFVNGKPIGTAPLDKNVTLGPGTHMVTANLRGKVPYSEQVRVEPGTRAKLVVVMKDFKSMIQYKTVKRYHWAVPATVTAVAAALLGAGVGLLIQGRNDVDDLQGDVNAIIQVQGVNRTFTYNTNVEDRAVNMQITGQALMGVAGGAAVAAVVLWLVRKKRVSYTPGVKAGAKGGKVEVRF